MRWPRSTAHSRPPRGTATRTLLLRGEPGVGKTRLAEEALAHALSRGWATHSGAAFTHTTNRPFFAWRPILRELLGDDPLADRHARANAVHATVARLTPARVGEAPLLGPVLDLEMPPTEATRALPPEASRRLLLALLVELVDAAAAEQPRLLFIDDVHWADPSSAELIERLAAATSQAPVLLLMTSREEGRRPELLEGAVVLSVGELPRDEAEDLARDLLREQHVSADVERLLDNAGGNPLFISHVVDAIRQARPGARTAADGLAVPRRLEGLLGNRIDQLEPQARELLRLASCFGVEFSAEQIAALDRSTHADSVDSMLCEQTRTGMIREVGSGRRTYRFSHGLVQKAAYEGMRFSRRRKLQTRVGTWIEQRNAEQLDAVLEELAYHFSQSDDTERGRSYCVRAAEKLASAFAYQESLGFYRMALDLTKARTAGAAVWRAQVLERMGRILYEMMLDDEAALTCKRALAILRRIPNSSTLPAGFPPIPTDWPEVPLEARLAFWIGHASLKPQQGARWLRHALEAAPRPLTRFRAEVLRVGGFTLSQAGCLVEAKEWSHRAVALARRSDDAKLLARCYLNVVLTNSVLGCHRDTVVALGSAIEAYRLSDPARAQPSVERESAGRTTCSARSRLRELMVEPDLFAAAAWWGTPSVESVEINIGYLAEAVGEFDIAEELWLSALARCERHGANRDSMETFYANIGASELWQGRHEAAELHLRAAIEAAARLGGDPATPASALLDLCRLELLRDHADSAAALREEALPFVRDSGLVEFDFAAELVRAQILLAEGEAEGAFVLARRVLGRMDRRGWRMQRPETLRTMALAEQARGRLGEADALFEQSVRAAAAMPSHYERALAELDRAVLAVRPARRVSAGFATPSSALKSSCACRTRSPMPNELPHCARRCREIGSGTRALAIPNRDAKNRPQRATA